MMPFTLPAADAASATAAADTDFSTVHNYNESAVFEAVALLAPRYPGVAHDPELLADVACVALNRLPPRYIRHRADFVFYMTDRERTENERELSAAVEQAFGFVQARAAMRARG